MTSLRAVLAAAMRAQQLARDLDKVRGPADLNQVAAGVQAELGTVVKGLSAALSGLEEAAVGNRPGKTRSDAPATSRAAARAIVVRSGTQRADVLLAIMRAGTATDYELQHALRLAASSERPRRGELVDAGMVTGWVMDGHTVTRRHEGADWTVWTLTEQGQSVARGLAHDLAEHPDLAPRETLW